MKKVMILMLSLYGGELSAQSTAAIKPSYFVGGNEVSSVDSFNRLILSILPDYHPINMDSSGKKYWNFGYRNTAGDKLDINYAITVAGGNAELKVSGMRVIENVTVNGQFLTMLKLYNGIFKNNVTAEVLRGDGGVHAPLNYHSQFGASYWFVFEPTATPAGYWWMLFRHN